MSETECKEKLIEKMAASKVLEEVFDELKKGFKKDIFIKANFLLANELECFTKNKKNELIGNMISKQGEASALTRFIVNNELLLSDEIIRRLKEALKETHIQLFHALFELLKLRAGEVSDE